MIGLNRNLFCLNDGDAEEAAVPDFAGNIMKMYSK